MKQSAQAEFDEFEAASVTECTGLMARAPINEFERDSYYDIMSFSPADFYSGDENRIRDYHKVN